MGINTDTDVQQAALGYTRTFGSNKLNDLRLGFGKLKNGHISPRANVDNVVGRLGINLPNDNPLYWGVPNIGITGLVGHRRGERRAVHQRRHDVADRRQLHVDAWRSTRSSSAASCGTCATTRSAAS